MDGDKAAAGGGDKTAPRDAAAPSSPARATSTAEGEKRSAPPLTGDEVDGAGNLITAANVDGGGGGEEEEDDEQDAVERFYALIANVRGMRGLYRSGGGGGGDGADSGNDGGGERKRARRANEPWRPVFRMEDFAAASSGDGAAGVSPSPARHVDDDVELRRRRRVGGASFSPPRQEPRP
uniref:Uncharacterized protein n=1 Tax=Leersia perrieri TaxID=77586 RepID=A0A0D9WFR2_9ORYZ